MKKIILSGFVFFGLTASLHAVGSPVRYVQISTNTLNKQSGNINIAGATISTATISSFTVTSEQITTSNITTATITNLTVSTIIFNGNTINATAAANTYTIPNPSKNANIVLSEGSQTLNSTFTFTGSLYVGNGTTALPGYSFGNDTDTGFFGDGLNTIRISVGNLQAAKFDSSGNFAMVSGPTFQNNDGSNSAPSYTFGSDTDTGIKRGGSNSVEIVSGGIVQASFTATGVSIVGTNTNDNAPTGYYGEYLSSSTPTDKSFFGSGTIGDGGTVTIGAGDWDCTACIYVDANGATVTDTNLGISQTTGNSSTGLVLGDTWIPVFLANSTSAAGSCMANVRESVSGSTPVYLKARATYSAATPRFRARFSCRRPR